MTNTAARRALWVSTSTATRGGGIASYVRAMQQTPLWSEWEVRHVVTHRDGSTTQKIATFALGGGAVRHRTDPVPAERDPPAFQRPWQLRPEIPPAVDQQAGPGARRPAHAWFGFPSGL